MDHPNTNNARAQARVGSQLNGKWHIDQLIGVGGMAAVYTATHRNGKRVAIKVLHPDVSANEDARQRFLREGYAANRVGHRGVVSVDDDGMTEDGVAFLVMELLDGETIEARCSRLGGTLKPREVLALMDQALATLEVAHEKQIVHRDLKPENLFLTREGVVKVLDFGLARVLESPTTTQTLGIMGTPAFMAPEQARGRWQDVDERTDLWAIGATMFALLSGRFVHHADTPNEMLAAAVSERAPSLADVSPEVHPEIVALVDHALNYERDARFQTAGEFRAALKGADAAIADDEPSPSLRVPARESASVERAGRLAVTTEGVAASIGAYLVPAFGSTLREKAVVAIAATVAGALFVLVGRGLFGDAGKPSDVASAPGAVVTLAAALPATTLTPPLTEPPATLIPPPPPATAPEPGPSLPEPVVVPGPTMLPAASGTPQVVDPPESLSVAEAILAVQALAKGPLPSARATRDAKSSLDSARPRARKAQLE